MCREGRCRRLFSGRAVALSTTKSAQIGGVRSYPRQMTGRARQLFVAAFVVVALVGCGKSESPAPSSPTAQQQDGSTTSATPTDTDAVRYLALGIR